MRKYFCFLVIVFLMQSCEKSEKNVDPDRIYSSYELIYHSDDNKTIVSVSLSLDGPEGELLELKEPAGLSFNGDKLNFNSANSVYFREYSKKIVSGTFTYIDHDNKTAVSSTPVIADIGIPPIERISNSQEFIFQWIGDPVGEKETVKLTLEGSESKSILLSSEPGVTEFIIPVNEIRSLDRWGSGVITVERTLTDFLNIGYATGGRISLRYKSEEFILFEH